MSRHVFDFGHAIVRTPAPSVVEGLRAGGEAPSHSGVLAEHRAYVAALEAAGVAVETLPPLADYPDSVFVEDPAFALPEGAILSGPARRAGSARPPRSPRPCAAASRACWSWTKALPTAATC